MDMGSINLSYGNYGHIQRGTGKYNDQLCDLHDNRNNSSGRLHRQAIPTYGIAAGNYSCAYNYVKSLLLPGIYGSASYRIGHRYNILVDDTDRRGGKHNGADPVYGSG